MIHLGLGLTWSKTTETSCGRPFQLAPLLVAHWLREGLLGAVPSVMAVAPSQVVRTGVWSLHVCLSPQGAQCEPGDAVLLRARLVPGAAALPGPVTSSSRVVRRCIRRFYFFFKWKLDLIPAEANWSCGNGLKANENELCRLQPQLSILLVSCFLKCHSFLNLALKLLRPVFFSGDMQSEGRPSFIFNSSSSLPLASP